MEKSSTGFYLRPSDGHHFLGDADGTAAHSDTKAVHAGVDQILGLCCGLH